MQRSIRHLAPETASRIAAGEVVERPLSALKEILENALDAGARAVDVRVERSLDQFFSVADDGWGIAAGEIDLALERHATSKITAMEDLDRLDSLGFRGEALPSIAAVSRLKITSRARDAEAATTLATTGGAIVARGSAARATGTTVEVADLFFNTPARRKFLHSAAGELRAAIRMVECYALAFPEVAFRLTVDGKSRLDLPAVGAGPGADRAARRERATGLWGARHAGQLLDAEGARAGVQVEALLGLPEHARATREGQVFLVNRRWIQSPALSQALRQAYGDLLPAGRFPAATLWLTVPPDRLDVNVHPTKREVRFADDSEVFAVVAGACAKPLAGIHPPFTVVTGGAEREPRWAERVREKPPAQTWLSLEPAALAGAPTPSAPAASAATESPPRAPASEPEMWQLHRTYILAPVRGGLVILDQHAAHERILYEEALTRLQGRRGVSQQLMFRSVVDLSQSQYDLILELGPWLQLLGWDLSLLGPPTVIVRGMPAELKDRPPGPLLQDILDGVNEATGRSGDQDIAEQLARSYACHAAVRAGDPLTPAEMRSLVDRLFATSKPHGDPHGRVTFVRLDLDELHRRFGRA